MTRFFKRKELSRDFVSSSRMTSNQEVTIRFVLYAVGVPDFTGVEDIFRLTVGQSGPLISPRNCEELCVSDAARFQS
jgi:hypothetical protein